MTLEKPIRGIGWRAAIALHLALLGAWTGGPSAASIDDAAIEEAREGLSADGITVDHQRGDSRYAARVLEICRHRGDTIAQSMSLPGLAPLRVVIAASDEEFRDATFRGAPDWGVGCAFPDRRLVVLKSPRIVTYPLQMEDVVVHELAHVAAGRLLRGVRAPRWFDEGVAMAVAGEWRLEESPSLASAAQSGHLIPLSALDRAFPSDRNTAALAYAESFHAVRFLMEESGIAEPGELVRVIAEVGDFDEGIALIYGRPRRALEDDVLAFFGRQFRWGLILRGGRLFFVVATGLFLIALAVRTRRARRRVREWEEEERAQAERKPGRRSGGSWN